MSIEQGKKKRKGYPKKRCGRKNTARIFFWGNYTYGLIVNTLPSPRP
jgi:hypothetical protein